MDLPSNCPPLRHTLSRERIEAAKRNIEERRQNAVARFSPTTASMVSMGIRALYPNLTLFLAETNPFMDDFQGGEECIDTVLDTISLAAVVQSCISLAPTVGYHPDMEAAKIHEFLDVNHGAPREVILEVSAEIAGHEQEERQSRHEEHDAILLEMQRMEWARLLPAARQELIAIRTHGQFPILVDAQRVIRVCQRDGLALGFLGRNAEPTRGGPPLLTPDLSLAHTLRPPIGLPQVRCQFIPGTRNGEINTFFYFTDRT
jgi:hypothetical protein